ncbi:MAG: ISNCY family transposase [Acidimicrobiales bacterium]|jgi:IS5 family transposase
MLRTVNAQPTLWEALLPEMCLVMPAELEAVDRLLDDEEFFKPFRAHFHAVLGRPSVPIETYLRLMFLKYRYRLGFEPLCREVADSVSWQRFCRIPLGVAVPHPTTLMKITTRCGSSAVEGLNEALLARAASAKVLKTNRVRADTTVVPADVAYPTDSGLLAKGVAKMAKAVGRLKAGGLAPRVRIRDRTQLLRRHARSIGANLRRRTEEAKGEVLAINARMARAATEAVGEAHRVALNARRRLRQLGTAAPPRLESLAHDLEVTAERVARIVHQTRQRLAGSVPEGATRLVSLHDPDARPIRKGRLGKPVEFGYKAQVVDNEDGIVLDHAVFIGNPPDAPMLVPAIQRISRRVDDVPEAVTADRGYGEIAVGDMLSDLGVRQVVLPTKGKPNAARRAIEKEERFQGLVRWRTGSEGRISCLKRDFGWNRTRIDGLEGAKTWCGHGVFNHNLVKVAALVVAR